MTCSGSFDDASTPSGPCGPNPGTNRAYQEGIDRPDGTLARFTVGLRAARVSRRSAAGRALRAACSSPNRRPISSAASILTDDGKTLAARKAYEKGEFVASTDERFRPVFISNAPDGTLYLVDMYRGIIQQRISITQYLHGEIMKRNSISRSSAAASTASCTNTTRRDESPALAGFSADQLVATLAASERLAPRSGATDSSSNAATSPSRPRW